MRRGVGGTRAALVYLACGLALGLACLLAQGPLPGDVALTRALQSALGSAPAWASLLTDTAKPPLIWATLAFATALAWLRGGLRRALAPPLALLGAAALDALLRALIFAPRPTPELVAVAAPSSSSALPSTFALVYGAMFGAVVLGGAARRREDVFAAGLSAVLVVTGSCARVVLGGHWPSQVLASLLGALAPAAAAITLTARGRR
jgi:membrane-associated phospholipid phosphatase